MNQHTAIPAEFKDRIKWGLYGGVEQYYITRVDGQFAHLGQSLPEEIARRIQKADRDHQKMYISFLENRKP